MSSAAVRIPSQPTPTADERRVSFSETVWAIDWSRHFPLALSGGEASVEYAGFDEAFAFIKTSFPEIYAGKRSDRFLDGVADAGAKERFYRVAVDYFLFKHDGRPIGIALGNPSDWGTYNLRNVSILPEAQGHGFYQQFFPALCKVLTEHGVERLEGHVSPANFPHIHALNKMGLEVTGLIMSERWGAVLQFTKFFSARHEDTFHNQFCQLVSRLSG